jgi:hypothetical protein
MGALGEPASRDQQQKRPEHKQRKAKRKQRKPISAPALVWLDEHHPNGEWKTISPKSLHAEMAAPGSGLKNPPSETTLARLRGTRKK